VQEVFNEDFSEVDVDEVKIDLKQPKSEYISKNFCPGSDTIAEVPFIHWSIYRQGIQNLLMQ